MAKSKTDHSKQKSKKTHGGNAANWVQQVVGSYPHSAQSAGINVIKTQVPSINLSGGGISDGAAGYVTEVNNVIPPAVGAPAILLSKAPTLVGGKKKRSNKRKGGDVLAELAVPAVLLIANQTFGKKTGKKYSYAKKRFSRRYRKDRK